MAFQEVHSQFKHSQENNFRFYTPYDTIHPYHKKQLLMKTPSKGTNKLQVVQNMAKKILHWGQSSIRQIYQIKKSWKTDCKRCAQTDEIYKSIVDNKEVNHIQGKRKMPMKMKSEVKKWKVQAPVSQRISTSTQTSVSTQKRQLSEDQEQNKSDIQKIKMHMMKKQQQQKQVEKLNNQEKLHLLEFIYDQYFKESEFDVKSMKLPSIEKLTGLFKKSQKEEVVEVIKQQPQQFTETKATPNVIKKEKPLKDNPVTQVQNSAYSTRTNTNSSIKNFDWPKITQDVPFDEEGFIETTSSEGTPKKVTKEKTSENSTKFETPQFSNQSEGISETASIQNSQEAKKQEQQVNEQKKEEKSDKNNEKQVNSSQTSQPQNPFLVQTNQSQTQESRNIKTNFVFGVSQQQNLEHEEKLKTPAEISMTPIQPFVEQVVDSKQSEINQIQGSQKQNEDIFKEPTPIFQSQDINKTSCILPATNKGLTPIQQNQIPQQTIQNLSNQIPNFNINPFQQNKPTLPNNQLLIPVQGQVSQSQQQIQQQAPTVQHQMQPMQQQFLPIIQQQPTNQLQQAQTVQAVQAIQPVQSGQVGGFVLGPGLKKEEKVDKWGKPILARSSTKRK